MGATWFERDNQVHGSSFCTKHYPNTLPIQNDELVKSTIRIVLQPVKLTTDE